MAVSSLTGAMWSRCALKMVITINYSISKLDLIQDYRSPSSGNLSAVWGIDAVYSNKATRLRTRGLLTLHL